MKRLECPVCGRLVRPIGTGWTGWATGLGEASGTLLAPHGPRDRRCAGRVHESAHISPREALYTAEWERRLGPLPDRTRVAVFDFDPDGPTEIGARSVDPGHVWLVLLDIDSTHGLDRVGDAVKIPEVRVPRRTR